MLLEFMFKGTMCCKSPLVNSGPTKKKVVTPPGQAPVTTNPSVSPPSSAGVLAERKCYPEKCVFLRIRLIRRNLAPQPDFGQFQPIIGQYSIFYIFLHLYYYYCYYSLVHLLNFRC